MAGLKREHRALKTRTDAHEIGAVMVGALLNPELSTDGLINRDQEQMPPRLRELGASWLSLQPESGTAILECGGGFHHFGYEVRAEGVHEYRMICYGEDENDSVDLGTFVFPPRP